MRRHDTSLDNNLYPVNRLNVMSTAMHYQRMHQQHQRQGNHLDRLSYPQQCKAQTSRRPNVGNELLTKLEQAGKVPSREKFRRMCCQTFLATGKCPYNDRCVFLHDPRLLIESFRLKAIKTVRVHGIVKDTFYWPDMEIGDVSSLLDGQGLPDAKQAYTIPHEFSQVPPASHHDRAMFSMWTHFVDICVENHSTNNSSKTSRIHSPTGTPVASNYHRSSSQSPSQISNHLTTLMNHTHLSPKVSPAAVGQYLSSPISIAINLSSPQGTPDTSKSPTPRQSQTSEEGNSLHQASVKIELSALGRQTGSANDPTVKHINKHLIGVWRLPMFVTLAGGSDRGDIPMNQCHYLEEDNDFLASFGLPANGRDGHDKNLMNISSFLPPPIGHEYNGREGSLRDLNCDFQRELNQSSYNPRSLYSDVHWSERSAHKDNIGSQQNDSQYLFSSHTASRSSPSFQLFNDNNRREFAAGNRSQANFEGDVAPHYPPQSFRAKFWNEIDDLTTATINTTGFGQMLQLNDKHYEDYRSNRISNQSINTHNRANSFIGGPRPLSAFRDFTSQSSRDADNLPTSLGQHNLEIQQRKAQWSMLHRLDNDSTDAQRQPLGHHHYWAGNYSDDSKHDNYRSLNNHDPEKFISNRKDFPKSNHVQSYSHVQSYHEHNPTPSV